MDNLPDDIRNFDWHPNSPFYVEPWPECRHCGEHYDPETGEDGLCDDCQEEDEHEVDSNHQ